MSVTLAQASTIVDVALKKAREMNLVPMTVAGRQDFWWNSSSRLPRRIAARWSCRSDSIRPTERDDGDIPQHGVSLLSRRFLL